MWCFGSLPAALFDVHGSFFDLYFLISLYIYWGCGTKSWDPKQSGVKNEWLPAFIFMDGMSENVFKVNIAQSLHTLFKCACLGGKVNLISDHLSFDFQFYSLF